LQEKIEHRLDDVQYGLEERMKGLENMIRAEAERLTEMQQVHAVVDIYLLALHDPHRGRQAH